MLAVNNLKGEVDEETIRKAIALCDWQLEVRKLCDPIDAEGKKDGTGYGAPGNR